VDFKAIDYKRIGWQRHHYVKNEKRHRLSFDTLSFALFICLSFYLFNYLLLPLSHTPLVVYSYIRDKH